MKNHICKKMTLSTCFTEERGLYWNKFNRIDYKEFEKNSQISWMLGSACISNKKFNDDVLMKLKLENIKISTADGTQQIQEK